MPGNAYQRRRVLRVDVQQRLRLGQDMDNAAGLNAYPSPARSRTAWGRSTSTAALLSVGSTMRRRCRLSKSISTRSVAYAGSNVPATSTEVARFMPHAPDIVAPRRLARS